MGNTQHKAPELQDRRPSLSPKPRGQQTRQGGGETGRCDPAPTQEQEDAIAIVGMSCRTAGADNIQEFWHLLENGQCHVGDVPADRWNAKAFLSEDGSAPGKAYSQRGAFIKDIEGFDNGLYRINDFEASQMDPQQRMLLHCTTRALEDAGITREAISGSSTGVYVGAMNNDVGNGIRMTSKMNSYTPTGISNTILASRLSYVFHLTGPCMVLDTACSASLVAVHQGCQAIRSGDCDMAICGGVNCILEPTSFILMSKTRMLSPTGLCHTFSDKADGYARGEGCGIVILKRLKDAIRDGDNIRAVVYTGTNQDGHAVTPMTAPSGEQQVKLLESVYSKFHLDTDKVHYIEAHGTGTPAGDPVEVNALGTFFSAKGATSERHIGSVKTNIAHTESAAGVMGLIKVILMMEHNMIVPSLHCDSVNPKIDLLKHNFVIPKNCIPWTESLKVAAVNSFGFGGSNCHAVVKSFKQESQHSQKRKRCIVCFSGKTQKSLKGSLKDFSVDEEAPLLDVHDVSYTSTARRDHYAFRMTFIVEDMDELMTAVTDQLMRDQWAPPVSSQPNIVFVFCGMGTAWGGMCRELLAENPVFADTLLKIEKCLSTFVPWSLIKRLQQEDPTQDDVFGPIAIFACQLGLTAVWRSLGIQPACVVGQSIGEIAAAYTAGCLSLPDAVKIIYHRSQLLSEVTGGAMMLVLNVGVEQVKQVLNGLDNKASIALEYSSRACAISADSQTLKHLRPQLISHLKSSNKDMKLMDLDVHVAYHSSHVNSAADKLKQCVSDINTNAPLLPFLSTVSGHAVTEPLQCLHWVDNVRKPVLFHQAIMKSVSRTATSSTFFLEVGPKPVLRAHMKDLFPNDHHQAVPSINEQSEMRCLFQSIARLYGHGVPIAWNKLPTHGNHVTTVPRYSFDKKHLTEKTELHAISYSGCNIQKKNHLFVYPTEESVKSFKIVLSPLNIPSVYQHVVMGRIVVPGAIYAECGLAVGRYLYKHSPVSVSVEFEQLVSLKKDEVIDFDVSHNQSSEPGKSLCVIQNNEKKLAVVQVEEAEVKSTQVCNMDTLRMKCKEIVNKDELYNALRESGFDYGAAFSLLGQARRNLSECLVRLELHETVLSEMADTIIHPCILDSMQHSVALVMHGIKIPVREMLPKSFKGLAVWGPMQPTMYVHTKLKATDSVFLTFGMELLSEDGHTLAEISSYTIQALVSQREQHQQEMLKLCWDKICDNPVSGPQSTNQTTRRQVLVFNESDTVVDNNVIHFKHDSSCEPQVIKTELDNLVRTHTMDAIVVINPVDNDLRYAADIAQAKLINMCLLLQSIFMVLNDHSMHCPVFVITFDAWPSPDDSTARQVNPFATGVFGLLRTIINEHIYTNVVGVDLHIPPAHLSSKSFHGFLDILMTDERFAHYPEFLITEQSIYVNQVARLTSSVPLPKQRVNLPTRMTDVRGQTIVLSESATKMTKLQAFSQDTPSFSSHSIVLKSDEFAVPSEKMFNTDLSCGHVLPERREHSSARVVLGLEVSGQASGEQLTSCGPFTVSPEVCVDPDTSLPTALLPQYQAGDLCKLVLFWNLVDNIPMTQFSILASSDTKHLADLVKCLACGILERKETDVNIILIENMNDDTHYHPALLSLVLVDVTTMAILVRGWKNASSFISLSCLVTSNVQVYAACVLPHTHLVLLDTQLMFQFHQLKKSVPRIKDWIEKDIDAMSGLFQHLHFKGQDNTNTAILNLLEFQSLRLSDLSVQLVDEKLFKKDGAYIVVGGLTGLGWLFVEFLAQNNAGFIAILNRRSATASQISDMNSIGRQFDCQIRSYEADISSLQSLEGVLQQLLDDWSEKGCLRGVFTGAAVLQDGFFPTMDRSSFEKVLTPKVKGTWNLHVLTKDFPLDYFVMHSSVVSVLGNFGQANYSAANAFIDGLAFYRRHLGLEAQSINWGPLDLGLMDDRESVKKRLDSIGFHLASKQNIRDSIPALLLLNWAQIIPVDLNTELFTKRIQGTGVECIIKRFQPLLVGTSQVKRDLSKTLENLDTVKHMQPAQRLEAIEDFVKDVASRILSIDMANISNDVHLYELGLDSVTAMMMISVIERYSSFKLPAVSFLGNEVTVAAIAQQLDACSNGVWK